MSSFRLTCAIASNGRTPTGRPYGSPCTGEAPDRGPGKRSGSPLLQSQSRKNPLSLHVDAGLPPAHGENIIKRRPKLVHGRAPGLPSIAEKTGQSAGPQFASDLLRAPAAETVGSCRELDRAIGFRRAASFRDGGERAPISASRSEAGRRRGCGGQAQ